MRFVTEPQSTRAQPAAVIRPCDSNVRLGSASDDDDKNRSDRAVTIERGRSTRRDVFGFRTLDFELERSRKCSVIAFDKINAWPLFCRLQS